MSSTVSVQIHSSQSPGNVRRVLIESLRARRVNHKFHYDSVRQTNQWLALHEKFSPSRNSAECAAIYDKAFAEAANEMRASEVHVLGLGCGGGQKDTRLLSLLKRRGKKISYTPSDVSVAMTLVARETALAVLSGEKIFPFVCDLATADDLAKSFSSHHRSSAARVITFFGMIPNFEPDEILKKLSALMGSRDVLLFSANLAPGDDYKDGVQKILPQYDNELTRDWLRTFLLDLGVSRGGGRLDFRNEIGVESLRRIVCRFHFRKTCEMSVDGKRFRFLAGENIRLFYSYRYTPELIGKNLSKHGLEICQQWITKSGEEGVFLCVKSKKARWEKSFR